VCARGVDGFSGKAAAASCTPRRCFLISASTLIPRRSFDLTVTAGTSSTKSPHFGKTLAQVGRSSALVFFSLRHPLSHCSHACGRDFLPTPEELRIACASSYVFSASPTAIASASCKFLCWFDHFLMFLIAPRCLSPAEGISFHRG
jgi:hypothetical protein